MAKFDNGCQEAHKCFQKSTTSNWYIYWSISLVNVFCCNDNLTFGNRWWIARNCFETIVCENSHKFLVKIIPVYQGIILL